MHYTDTLPDEQIRAPRKKVLFVITKSTLGGAQRYVYDLATNLPSSTYDVVVAAGGDGMLIDNLTNEGYKVYALKSLKRDVSFMSEVRALFELFSIIRKERPEVLHLNSSKAGALGAILGRLCGIPRIIFTAHGWAFNEDRSTSQKLILKAIHFVTIALSHTTIAVSNGMKAQMNWRGVQRKMVVVYPGRNIEDMLSKEDARGVLETKVIDTQARLMDYHDDFWVGTIAELHPIKRLNRAIDSISALIKTFPTLRFVIIHDGDLRAQLQSQVQDLGLQEHVFFTGALDKAARFLPAFDAFVLPSKSEAFGYVLLEAGIAGVPVVATDVGGIPDIITHEVNGLLVPPDNTPALTQALRTLIADEDLRHQLSHAHQERSLTFTVEKMVAETQRVYES